MAYMICRHIKSSGRKCDAPAMRGLPYCYFHMKLHRRLHHQPSATAADSTPGKLDDAALDLPVMEDLTAVRLALTQVIQDLGAKRLDYHRAGRLLYGIQIASQLVERPKYEYNHDSVQNVTTGDDGDELGPADYECGNEDSCSKCPFATEGQCNRWVYVNKKDDAKPGDDTEEDDDDRDDDDGDEDENDGDATGGNNEE